MPAVKADLKQILELVKPELDKLEQRLIEDISKDSRALTTIVQDIFKAGGKRLRPAISFLVYKALLCHQGIASPSARNDDLVEKLFLVAEISELIHTASLVHDDIIDNALVRRSMPTMNSKWNNAITVISGDFMFARAAVNLGKLDINEIVNIYAAVLEHLCAGEIEQIEHKYDTELNWDYYYSKTYKKTASLIEASASAVAVLLDTDDTLRSAITSYGRELGMAFQLVDDILDYTADAEALGKPAGSDLKDGQVTIPVLHAQQALQGTDACTEFSELISQIASGEDKLAEVISYIESTKAIAKSQATAAGYVERAKLALSPLNDSKYKTALLDLADFVLSRSH
jgi:all-trans-nonaprenyl-diphosphate synthase